MPQYKVLVDSNVYFRLAREIHPLLQVEFGTEKWCLYVIDGFEGEYLRSSRLKSEFSWVSEQKYKANRTRPVSLSRRDKKLVAEKIEANLGKWVRVQLFLMFLIGSVSYIGLRLLEIEFCLPLAILAGLLEIVPSVGPTLSAVPAIIAGFTLSPGKGVMVALLYIVIQQIENDIVVPKVMQRGLNFNPLVVLIGLAVGFKLGGIGGMALAVPVLIVLREFLREFVVDEESLQI